jgi:hypothetical protein
MITELTMLGGSKRLSEASRAVLADLHETIHETTPAVLLDAVEPLPKRDNSGLGQGFFRQRGRFARQAMGFHGENLLPCPGMPSTIES